MQNNLLKAYHKATKELMPKCENSEWKVFTAILNMAYNNNSRTVTPSYSDLRGLTGISSDRTISKALKSLINKGAFTVLSGGGREVTNKYTLSMRYW